MHKSEIGEVMHKVKEFGAHGCETSSIVSVDQDQLSDENSLSI